MDCYPVVCSVCVCAVFCSATLQHRLNICSTHSAGSTVAKDGKWDDRILLYSTSNLQRYKANSDATMVIKNGMTPGVGTIKSAQCYGNQAVMVTTGNMYTCDMGGGSCTLQSEVPQDDGGYVAPPLPNGNIWTIMNRKHDKNDILSFYFDVEYKYGQRREYNGEYEQKDQ